MSFLTLKSNIISKGPKCRFPFPWKINILKTDTRISFYSCNTHILLPKPKYSFRHLKRGIQDFHMNYVLVPAHKAANNVVVV